MRVYKLGRSFFGLQNVHKAAARSCSGGSNEVLIEDKDIIDGQTVLKLSKATGHRKTGRAHSIRHHKNEIPLSRRFRLLVLLLRCLVLR